MSYAAASLERFTIDITSELKNSSPENLDCRNLIRLQGHTCFERGQEPGDHISERRAVRLGLDTMQEESCRWDICNGIAFQRSNLELEVPHQSIGQDKVGTIISKQVGERDSGCQDVTQERYEYVAAPTFFTVGYLLGDINRRSADDGCNHYLGPHAGIERLDSGRTSVLVENSPSRKCAQAEAGGADSDQISLCNSLAVLHGSHSLSLWEADCTSPAYAKWLPQCSQ